MGIDFGKCDGYSAAEIYIINYLASGSKSYAEIKKNTPDIGEIFKNLNIEGLLNKFASPVIQKDVFASQKYQLKDEFFRFVNPFYVGRTDDEGPLVIENVNKKSPVNIFAMATGQISSFNFRYYMFAKHYGEPLLRCMLEWAHSLNIKTQMLLEVVWLCKLLKNIYPPLNVPMSDSLKNWLFSAVNEAYSSTPSIRDSIFSALSEVLESLRELPKLDTMNSDTLSDSMKKTVENRKRSILDSMKSRQIQFAETNAAAMFEIEQVANESLENKKMFTGTCVVCQELCDENSDPFGFFSLREKASIWKDYNETRTPIPKDCNLCFHMIHEKCFRPLRRSLYNLKKCPLCGFLSDKLLLVPFENVQHPTMNDAAPYPVCTYKYRKYTRAIRGCAQQYASLLSLDAEQEIQEVIKKAQLFIQKTAAVN